MTPCIFISLGNMLIIGWPGVTTIYGLLVFNAIQCLMALYTINLINNSLELTKESFSKLNINDVLSCISRAILSLSSGQITNENIDILEISNFLKSSCNISIWEKLKIQQVKELGGITSLFMNNINFDLSDELDKDILLTESKDE